MPHQYGCAPQNIGFTQFLRHVEGPQRHFFTTSTYPSAAHSAGGRQIKLQACAARYSNNGTWLALENRVKFTDLKANRTTGTEISVPVIACKPPGLRFNVLRRQRHDR